MTMTDYCEIKVLKGHGLILSSCFGQLHGFKDDKIIIDLITVLNFLQLCGFQLLIQSIYEDIDIAPAKIKSLS